MVIGEVLAKRAFITPHRLAMLFQDQVISYLAFDQRTNQCANALLSLGVKPGDRLGLLMHNCPQFIEDILDKPESAGRPYFEVDLRIVDGNDRPLPAGEAGELVVRCPHMMTGYYNRPDATQATIVDGWVHTGDMAYLDKDGYLYIIDRLKDMIVSGGENVYPAEIEKVLLQMSEIDEASVVGIPDDKWGEVPKAYIVCKHVAPPSDEAIIAFCRQHLAGYKIPRHIEMIDELPKNPSGKVLKKVLRQRP